MSSDFGTSLGIASAFCLDLLKSSVVDLAVAGSTSATTTGVPSLA
jgi:hypothetical protein